MAIYTDINDRRVIPNWDKFIPYLPEIPLHNRKPMESLDISAYEYDWEHNQSLSVAGDLISAAIVSNNTENPSVKKAISFVLNNADERYPVLLDTVKYLISGKKPINKLTFQLTDIQRKIAELKKRLILYPHDAIVYIEMARNYLMLGCVDKAERYIESALSIDSNNRFIVRSACRFYVHKNDTDKALYVLQKSSLLKHDPWLMASEISVRQLEDKTSNLLKLANTFIESQNFSPLELCELNGSLATQELISGNYKKSRKLLRQTIIMPNDNSLAQAQWLSSQLGIEDNYKVPLYYFESQYWNYINEKKYEEALDAADNLIAVRPYSTRVVLNSSSMAICVLKNRDWAIERLRDIDKYCIKKNAAIVNNLAYALALEGKYEEADGEYNRAMKYPMTESSKICLMATKGLIELKRRNFNAGISYYKNAIEAAKNNGSPYLATSASLNFVHAILQADHSNDVKNEVENILNKLDKTMIKNDMELSSIDKDIKVLMQQKH